MIVLFWLALATVLYAYIGFPFLLWLRAVSCPRPWKEHECFPRVTVVIAAYNEARCIARRIENILSQDYPPDRLRIVVASDGSSDGTDGIVARHADERVVLVSLPRRGKGPALNAAVEAASGDVLVFTDANTHFAPDTLRALGRPFSDPEVGGVAGNQVYLRGDLPSSTADGERLYWNYDQWIKSLQSRAGSVTSATGAIYAIRRPLFEPVPPGAMDDFYLSTGVIERGYRLVYAADARAYEPVAEVEGVEFSRKLRVIKQGLRAVACRASLLVPSRYGFYSWQLFSHKVLRRFIGAPLLLLGAVAPFLWNEGPFYQVIVLAEAAGLACLLASFIPAGTRLLKWRPLAVISYFAMVNAAALAAAWALLRGERVHLWEPERHAAKPSPSGRQELETWMP